ncbi:MAG: ThuA domain-containing protein [Cyclobacteriaceae bacterium]|nr:ThuA domain-containing protein [Cyclobacteriaceae bacterium]
MFKTIIKLIPFLTIILLSITLSATSEAKKKKKKKPSIIKVLLIDGQSKNHKNWKEWTPILLKQLDDSNLFRIDIATSPMKGESLDKFNPKFRNYDVVISTYDGDNWSMRAQRNFEKYITDGGGLVVIHAADNAFPDWEAYNLMIGLGGWGNRTEMAGPYMYFNKKGDLIRDTSPGNGGQHGPRHEYMVETRSTKHPIMKDIPVKWLHTEDELYAMLRGPAMNMEILATAYSDEKYDGTQRHEPILMTIKYGKGRVFHTVMGHHQLALSCVGFMTTFIRGCQWAAKKEVSFEVPEDFPSENATESRTY